MKYSPISNRIYRGFSSGWGNSDSFSRGTMGFSDAKAYMRPIYTNQEKGAMTFFPMKGKYGFKNDYLTLLKPGYLFIEFIRFNSETNMQGKQTLDWKNKEYMTLEPKKALELAYLFTNKDLNINFESNFDTGMTKTLTIRAVEKGQAFHFDFQKEQGNDRMKISNKISFGEMLLLQRMINYSVPFMMGWQIMETGKVSEDDIVVYNSGQNDF